MDKNLESLKKLGDEIKAGKKLSFFLTPEQRKQVMELYDKFTNLTSQLDLFNKNFSDHGWCAYDCMNVPLMESANKAYETGGIDAGERVLLDYYKSDVRDVMHWIKNKSKTFMARYDLLQKAFEDHFAERYYASVPLFLIIIDGAVNDFTKSKGFFADGTDMSAWDCVVGCNDGLTKLKAIFNTSRTVTTSEEIRLPYRNGILHGRDLNYGNEYVSCKCVSLMFALADWMQMKDSEVQRKEKFEKESNPPPIRESLRKIAQNKIDREDISKWKARNIVIGQDISATPSIEDCKDVPYIVPFIEMFEAWGNNNYGNLSKLLKNMFSYEGSEKKRAGECRKLFCNKKLLSYELKEINEEGCALSRILVEASWKTNDKECKELLEFGCLYEGNDGKVALPWKNNGEWIIYPRNIQSLYR